LDRADAGGGLDPADAGGVSDPADAGEGLDRAVERQREQPGHEMLMTLTAVPDEVLHEIVDDVFLPLVTG
jgi:hypothetical protein